MKNWRKALGALCIMAVMVLGAFAGLAVAQPGAVSVSPNTNPGTRGEDRRLMSAFDEDHKAMSAGEAEQFASHSMFGHGAASIVEAAPPVTASTSPGGPSVNDVTQEQLKQALLQGATVTYNGETGKVSMRMSNPGEGTRNHLVGTGAISAGGPYGGPNTFEGGPAITFTVIVNDPSLFFFRWDFNNDGVFDYPDQTGGGNLGKWTTDTSVARLFDDDYFGKVVVQGWDGVSTTVVINTGDNGLSSYNIQYLIGFGTFTFANRFKAKANVKMTQLGHYHYAYNLFQSVIYSGSGTLLGQCTAVHVTFQWNWCTLATPVNIVLGEEYVLGVRTTSYGNLISAAADSAKVHYLGLYYCFSSSLCYPSTFFSAAYTLMADFKWEETLIFPDAAVADATLDINNVAPSVFGVLTNPNPALEGTPAQLTAEFSDAGSGDTWEYRWTLHDGRVSPWFPVSKFNGGAKILWLHTWTGSIDAIVNSVKAKCGNFCTKTDVIDWGPLGTNAIPPLSTLTQYDVVIVGTNYFHYMGDAIGDRLADYMDAGGNVVTMQFALDNAFGCNGGICGRFENEEYSPVPRGYSYGAPGDLGAIHVPGHPLLDGVAGIHTNAYSANIFDVTSAATRIADWNNGRVLAATNENPNGNGARAVALNFFPPPEYGATSGDYVQLITNAIRWASRQPDPTLKPMPIQLDPFSIAFKDDDPTTTTPMDSFPVKVEVRDDDHGKVRVTGQSQLSFNDFELTSQCNGQYYLTNTWPPGWSSNPNPYGWVCSYVSTFGSRGPNIWYYYNDPSYGTGDGHSYLYTPTFDFSAWFAARITFNTYWQANFPSGGQDGYVEASVDGGATWTEMLSYHHNNPASYRGPAAAETTSVGGYSSVMFRFRYESNDDWWWFVDNIRIIGVQGSIVNGLGEAVGDVTVANVPPTAIGGFDSALRTEAQGLEFSGFEIADPALLEPTEWYAYKWNFDDGTPTDWRYVGTLAPPKSKVFIIHTVCLGLIGSTCSDLNGLKNTLLAQDDVASVDTFNFINYPSTPIAPTLSQMQQYDVIIVATNWAYFSFAPFDLARRQVGDRLAAYLDSGRGGALTMMCVYCLSGGNDLFNIRGRYLDDQYGAYENANYMFPGASGIDISQPEHDIFVKVDPDAVGSMFIHAGDQDLTVGGNNNAAGQDGIGLATWKDGTSAVGAKFLNNGMRTAHFGAFANPTGTSTGMLLRNLVGWVAGGIPSPKIAPFTHTYGDNGVYNVDLSLIDDDMGYVWDAGTNSPMAALPDPEIAHRFVPVTVDNVDPTIDTSSIQAYIAGNACLRVSGKEWGTVVLKMYTDGGLTTNVQVTRTPGSPNSQAKCGLMRVDVLATHSYRATVEFTPQPGKTYGSNPFWVIFDPWRKINPGHGTTVFSGKFKVQNPAGWLKDMDLPNLRRNLFDSGRGAPVEFAVSARDPGTDDLAFVWMWEDGSIPTVQVHKNLDGSVAQGVLGDPQHLGFGEPFFDRSANTIRSPAGTMGFSVRDVGVHRVQISSCSDDDAIGLPGTLHDGGDDGCGSGQFGGYYRDDWSGDGDWRHADDDDCDEGDDGIGLPGTRSDDDDDDEDCGDATPQLHVWVALIVLDDDNSRGYASPFFHDGTDMEFMVVQLW